MPAANSAKAVYRGDFPVVACLKSLVWYDAPELAGLPKHNREILEKAALSVDAIPEIPSQAGGIGAAGF